MCPYPHLSAKSQFYIASVYFCKWYGTIGVLLFKLFIFFISYSSLLDTLFYFMATASWKYNHRHLKLYYRRKHPALKSCPQKRGVVIRCRICTPRKPNSARRPVVKLFLSSTRRKTIAHLPGQGHTLRRHSKVLINGGGPKDLPGVHYTCIRGKFDFDPVRSKTKRRSIYGVKRPVHIITHVRRKLRELLKS